MKAVIILGSARNDGNTRKIVDFILEKTAFDLEVLSEMKIGPFDYEHRNRNDDFLPLMRRIVDQYDLLIFATPVYWYSMSGILKNFFDRITDCLTIEKETGRKLRGKACALISCSSGPQQDPVFSRPIKASAEYLGMDYIADVHSWLESGEIPVEVQSNLAEFIKKLTPLDVLADD